MQTDEILDQPENDGYSKLKDASKGKRLANHIVDIILFYIVYILITMVVMVIFPNSSLYMQDPGIGIYAITIAIYLLYYSLMEFALKGRTIGKFITRTRAISLDGGRLTFSKAIARSACRLIPFEPFSFLGSKPTGWHDTITDTRVIDESKN